MIPRYSRPQMAAIWTPENRFRIWIEIEAHACDAMAEMGVIPKDAAKAIWAGGKKAMEALKADPQGNIAKIATCAIPGPVGTFANVDPKVEEHVAKKLGLAVEPVSTQVIPRDRHAAFFATLGVIASSAENLATEIRHLQRTEVREAEEFFSEGQKGSSSMPHKRNPVLTENVTGLARLVRGAVMPALENVTTRHERDISHSSLERV